MSVKSVGLFIATLMFAFAGDMVIMGSAHAATPAPYTRYTRTVCTHSVQGDKTITNCSEAVRYVPVSMSEDSMRQSMAHSVGESMSQAHSMGHIMYGTSATVGQVNEAPSGHDQFPGTLRRQVCKMPSVLVRALTVSVLKDSHQAASRF